VLCVGVLVGLVLLGVCVACALVVVQTFLIGYLVLGLAGCQLAHLLE